MIRRPPRSTLDRSSAASDVYKRQILIALGVMVLLQMACGQTSPTADEKKIATTVANQVRATLTAEAQKPAAATAVAAAPSDTWLLYTSDAADERSSVDLGGPRQFKKKNKAHEDE